MGNPIASRADVARLFGRVGFGALPADLDAWTGKPYADLVEHLLAPPPGSTLATDEIERSRILLSAGGQNERYNLLLAAQRWWLERMRSTAHPLLERMTLLWHDHFATAWNSPYPDVAMLMKQNQTLRTHALGSFRDMAIAMNTDPAMLYWLDGATSARPVPNENYGRELMELFVLGKYPQTYSETDVREAARILTGWVVNATTGASEFKAPRHDAGRKTVLGRTFGDTGEQEHVELTDHLLAQPVAARFLAYKMVRSLAYDTGANDLLRAADPLVVKVADTLRKSGWNITAALRTLLLADEFRYADGRKGHQLVRQPVVVFVAACRAMGQKADAGDLWQYMNPMGQELFLPPSVAGWTSGISWLSPPTMIARYNFGLRLWEWANSRKVVFPPTPDLASWAAMFGLPGFVPATERSLRQYLADSSKRDELTRQRALLSLILTSPDWMVL